MCSPCTSTWKRRRCSSKVFCERSKVLYERSKIILNIYMCIYFIVHACTCHDMLVYHWSFFLQLWNSICTELTLEFNLIEAWSDPHFSFDLGHQYGYVLSKVWWITDRNHIIERSSDGRNKKQGRKWIN